MDLTGFVDTTMSELVEAVEKTEDRSLPSLQRVGSIFFDRTLDLLREGSRRQILDEAAALSEFLCGPSGERIERDHPGLFGSWQGLAELLTEAARRSDPAAAESILRGFKGNGRRVLEILAERGSAVPRSEIRKRLDLSESNLSHLLRDLHEADLITRHRETGREIVLDLGPVGRDIVQRSVAPKWVQAVIELTQKVCAGDDEAVDSEAQQSEKQPTVFIIDDDAHARASLAWMLESSGRAVELHASAEEFLLAYDAEKVGCLIADLRLPGMSGIALLEELVSRRSTLPVILLTPFGETRTAVQALRLGAFDFVEGPLDTSLLDRVQRAIEYHELLCRFQQQQERERKRLDGLTNREREVMELVVQGLSNNVIALELGVSEKTVVVHRSRVMHKLNVKSVADLVRLDTSIRGIRREQISNAA
jgi:FixJ family two-component response regulator/DNA-binding transcriptional ArsR family regulator